MGMVSMAPLRDPFLLPLCDCGGAMNLASLEPHPTHSNREMKTYRCSTCNSEKVYEVRKRGAAVAK
jgi:hypothetical protein